MISFLKIIPLILLFFSFINIKAQQGNKYVTNFSPSQYKASDQNWCSVQDKNGMMYFANLNGVLVYNGKKWQIVQLPNEANVTSLDINEANQVFVGAENEFGYIIQNEFGKFKYKSLSDSILKSKHDFSVIWATYCIDNDVYFGANEKLFKYSNNIVTVFNPEKDRFHTFFNINNHLFVREFEVGLKVFENNDLHFVLGTEVFADKKVYAIMPINHTRYLLASRNGGMYYFNYNDKHPSQSTTTKATSKIDGWLLENELYCGKKVSENVFALGSLKKGMLLIDSNFNILSQINSSNGLQDDAIKNISVDANKNLWLSFNKGIAYYEQSTPITHFGKQEGIDGVVENSIKFNNVLFIATDKGLKKINEVTNKFIPSEITSPCYVLAKSTNSLFITTSIGTYEFNGKNYKLINDEPSFSCCYNIKTHHLYIGTENSLIILNEQYQIIKRFDDVSSVRSIVFDDNGNCAFGTNIQGVYTLNLNYQLKNIGIKEGLPNLNETNVFTFNGKVFITTDFGFFEFTQNNNSIITSNSFKHKAGWTVNKAHQINNQIWFQSSKNDQQKDRLDEISVFDKKGNDFIMPLNYLNRIQNSDIKHFLLDTLQVLISTNQGLYTYQLAKYKEQKKFNVILTKVKFGNDTNKVYENFTSDFKYIAQSFNYYDNKLTILPSATSFYESQKIEFSYYLDGEETGFKPYDVLLKIEYSNLPERDYVFHIKAKDIFGNETEELIFKFTINPPWHRTIWAYLAYTLLAIILIAIIIKIYTKRLTKKNIELEVTITERTKTIVNQNKELEHKNKEITDSINYAQRIQKSLLASDAMLAKNLKDYFIFFQPKDIVSGDFYWGAELSNDEFLLVTADSTGHGVPGAIMSMLNISCLNEAIEAQKCIETKDILNYTRLKIIKHLANDGSESGGKDGMDCSIINFNFNENYFTYSAANNPIWIIRNNELIELKPDKMPVGKHDRDNISFLQHKFNLIKGDVVYTLTDGMPDQFGGAKGKKYMYKQLKELIISISALPMLEQKEILTASFNTWKGNLEQIDDVLLIGVKV